jgi:hypothetical protein
MLLHDHIDEVNKEFVSKIDEKQKIIDGLKFAKDKLGKMNYFIPAKEKITDAINYLERQK